MKPVYAMALAYKSLALAHKELTEINAEIKTASKNDFKLAMRTETSMLIFFTSEVPHLDIKARMQGLAYGDMRYALFAVNQLIAGFLDTGALEWLMARLPREDSRTAPHTPYRNR